MRDISELVDFLKNYRGRHLRIMEVCGSHTQAIVKYGIKSLLSEDIELLSGPGCPVCVTATAYIDRLIELSHRKNTAVMTFGDLMRVPGSGESLAEAKGKGGRVEMVYSPMDMLTAARENPGTTYVFAAVSFETTAPVYTMLLDETIEEGLNNIRLLTALKTMPPALAYLLDNHAAIDGFIAPGHVSAVTGADYFNGTAEKYHVPLAISGFREKELVISIYGLVNMILKGEAKAANYYTSVVEAKQSGSVKKKLKKYYEPRDAYWRGMGLLPGSGLFLRDEYALFDEGSYGLNTDVKKNSACRCAEVLMGKIRPKECPLFKEICTPLQPMGACMVSEEGACFNARKEHNG